MITFVVKGKTPAPSSENIICKNFIEATVEAEKIRKEGFINVEIVVEFVNE